MSTNAIAALSANQVRP
nr:hypothetical protein [Duganella sp. BJB1802]